MRGRDRDLVRPWKTGQSFCLGRTLPGTALRASLSETLEPAGQR